MPRTKIHKMGVLEFSFSVGTCCGCFTWPCLAIDLLGARQDKILALQEKHQNCLLNILSGTCRGFCFHPLAGTTRTDSKPRAAVSVFAFFSAVPSRHFRKIGKFPQTNIFVFATLAQGDHYLEKVQGATRLGATGLRASERKCCL